MDSGSWERKIGVHAAIVVDRILIHDPPRQHPAQWHSHHHALTDRDIYHHFHHHLASPASATPTTTHPGLTTHAPLYPEALNLLPAVKDEDANNFMVAIKRRRSSLQAILVPSFLFPNSTPTQPSPSPLSETLDSALDAEPASRPGSPDHASVPPHAKARSRAPSAVGVGGALPPIIPNAPPLPSIDTAAPVPFPAESPSLATEPLSVVSPVAVAGPAAVLAALSPAGSKERQLHGRRRSKTLVEMFRPARASPPPDFLLDDDPFANLTGSPMQISQPLNGFDSIRRRPRNLSVSSASSSSTASTPSLGMSTSTSGTSLASSTSSSSISSPTITPTPTTAAPLPRSPLHETAPTLPFAAPLSPKAPVPFTLGAAAARPPTLPARSPTLPNIPLGYPGKSQSTALTLTSSVPSSPIVPHTGSIRATPAHQRPAFRPRPSLPSLNTLARMNVVLTKKVRKGRVGAGLPFEPWDDLPSDDDSGPTTPAAVPPTFSRAAPVNGLAPQSPTPTSLSTPTPELVTSPSSPSPASASLPPLPQSPVPTEQLVTAPLSTPTHFTSIPPAVDELPPRPTRPLLPSEIMSLGSAVLSEEFEVVAPVSMMPKRSASLSSSPLASSQQRYDPVGVPEWIQPLPPPPPLPLPEVYMPEAPMPMPLVGPTTPLPVIEETTVLSEPSVSTSRLPPSAPTPALLGVPTLPALRPLSDFAPDLPAHDAEPTPAGAVVVDDEVFYPAEQPHIAIAMTEDVEPEMVFARPEGEDEEDQEEGGYVDDVLDRYHTDSRAASEDGHGEPEHASEAGGLAIPPTDGTRLSVVEEELSQTPTANGLASRSVEDTYNRSPPASSEGHGSHLLAPSTSSHSITSDYGSLLSSASISRSASFRSYESGMSSDSGSGRFHRHSDLYDDEEAIEERLNELFEDDADDEDAKSSHSGHGRSFRSFGALHGYISASMSSNQSLSSLDLDLEGESEENVMSPESMSHESDFGAPAYPTETLLLQRYNAGGRSATNSSGRPSLSRTRSSEDDAESDMVHSPIDHFNDIAYSQPRIREGRYSLRQSLSSSYGARLHEDHRRTLQLQLDPPLMSMSMAAVDMIHDPQRASVSDSEDLAVGEDAVHEAKGFGFGFDPVTTGSTAADGVSTRAVDREENDQEAIPAGDDIDITAVDGHERLTRDARTSEYEGDNVIDTDISLRSAGLVSTNSVPVQASTVPSSFPSPTSSVFSPPGSSLVSSVASPNPPSSPQYSQTEFSQADHTMGTAITRMMGDSRATSSNTFFSEDDESSSFGDALQYGAGGMPGSWTSSSRAPQGGTSTHASNGAHVYRSATTSAGHHSGYSSMNYRGRGYGQRRAGGSNGDDDEDEEEQRRRRLIANMGHRADDQVADVRGGQPRAQPVARSATTSRSRPTSRSANVPSPLPVTPVPRSAPVGQPNARFPTGSATSSRYVSEEESEESAENSNSDDDVPLAQSIPGALRAQKTIRRQVREEREQRKQDRALRNEARRERQETLRPAGAGTGSSVNTQGLSSSHDAAVAAAAASAAVPPTQGVSPYDLSKKLQNIQLASPPAHRQHLPTQQPTSEAAPLRSKSVSRPSGEYPRPHDASYPQSPVSPAVRSRSIRHPAPFSPVSASADVPPVPILRPSRSFHRPSNADRTLPEVELPVVASPIDADHRVSRSNTRASAREAPPRRSLSTKRPSTSDRPSMPSEPLPPMPISLRTSMDNPRKLQKSHPPTETHAPSARTSYEADQPATLSARQPGHMASKSNALVQQRVFVGNLQQFHMVEIRPNTTARDVVATMDASGALTGWAGSGGWMVFEVAQDFGMERPVRSFELLADVQSSWLKDKTVNFFILKLTPMAIPLSRNAIPSSSPVHSGYVEWEAKRGKWSKRWLSLREHSLWLSKRDNGKDEVMICSLSNFDVYQVTRANRAPKPFSFAVKSTDNLSFFENTADYMHTFSCSEKDGNIWLEKILVARSYVLQQERQVLFTGSKPAAGPATTAHAPSGATVTRAGTRKLPSAPPRHVQPLVSLPPMYVTAQNNVHTDVFEPGSLLSKQL